MQVHEIFKRQVDGMFKPQVGGFAFKLKNGAQFKMQVDDTNTQFKLAVFSRFELVNFSKIRSTRVLICL